MTPDPSAVTPEARAIVGVPEARDAPVPAKRPRVSPVRRREASPVPLLSTIPITLLASLGSTVVAHAARGDVWWSSSSAWVLAWGGLLLGLAVFLAARLGGLRLGGTRRWESRALCAVSGGNLILGGAGMPVVMTLGSVGGPFVLVLFLAFLTIGLAVFGLTAIDVETLRDPAGRIATTFAVLNAIPATVFALILLRVWIFPTFI